MKPTIDNFSTTADQYALYRPDSPEGIYDFLYAHTPRFGQAWDCGTGNGQVAVRLADRFGHVFATDISAGQLARAIKKDNINYLEERAEATTLPDASIDLITIAQAIHWFDFDAFYKEVKRVARPEALIAAWTYSLFKVNEPVDAVIDHFYMNITRPYWDKERDYVDAGYATIPFPFKELAVPQLQIIRQWTIRQLEGYLRTWSGVIHYGQKTGEDPVTLIGEALRAAWGNAETLEIRWPVHVRAGIVA